MELLQSIVRMARLADPLVAMSQTPLLVLQLKKRVLHYVAPINDDVAENPVPLNTTWDRSSSLMSPLPPMLGVNQQLWVLKQTKTLLGVAFPGIRGLMSNTALGTSDMMFPC